MNHFRMNGNHAELLADGRAMAPGDSVLLTDEELSIPFNRRLVEDEILVPIKAQEEGESTVQTSNESKEESDATSGT